MTCLTAVEEQLLDDLKAEVVLISAAISNLLTNNISSYTHDTVQGRQVVTKLNLSVLYKERRQLLDEIMQLEARCGNITDGAVYVGAAF